jgi:hypothetical protein
MENITDSKNSLLDVVVLYHGHCQDGFGSAFAAWKKFGSSATYLPCSDRVNPPEGLVNKELYILDFSFPKETLLALEQANKRLVVIDHHISGQEAVTSVKEHVFSLDHAASYLSWNYFVGGGIPEFITFLEIIDLAKDKEHLFVNTITYILSKPYSFEAYEELLQDFNSQEQRVTIETYGKIQHDYLELLINAIIEEPDFVVFEGYTVPCVNIALPINEKSIALNKLYVRYPPFSMSYRFDNGLLKVSLRGNGDVDLTLLAGKYGGGGHRSSSGFVLPASHPLPFVQMPPRDATI